MKKILLTCIYFFLILLSVNCDNFVKYDTNIELYNQLSHSQIIIDTIHTNFYKDNSINIEEVYKQFQILEILLIKSNKNSAEFNKIFVLYLESCKVISSLYSSGTIPEYISVINSFDAVIEYYIKSYTITDEICMAYANYLYSKLSWENKKSKITKKLSTLYRQVLLLNPDYTEAQIKLIAWHINYINDYTYVWAGFVRLNEDKLLHLSEIDRFNAYIQYSLYYMKNYNTTKGREFLSKAKQLFPKNILPLILESNYEKGIFELK